MPSVDVLRARLRDHVQRNGLKTSTRRDLILETLVGAGRHITADDLLRAVRARDARIGAATVYRTLRILQESGIVSERRFEGGATRFELTEETHHDHLICTGCDTIIEFEDEMIENHQKRIAERYGFDLLEHRHELYGLCAVCRTRTARG